jgi:4-amino-4-deoxy-L-arabinose transferase-like glycosyltransferase
MFRLPCRLPLAYFPPSVPLMTEGESIIFKSGVLSSVPACSTIPAGIIFCVKSRKGSIAVLLALVVFAAIPRLSGINLFATVDEPYWLTAGSDFYYALGQRDFANTVYDYHPAVTTMWIVGAAMLIYFPQYRGLGQGYFDVYKDTLDRFLLAHGHSALGLLTTARVVQILLLVFLLLVAFWLLRRLLGGNVAVVGTLLICFDPFFLGHSRLLNHEGMLSLFVMISVLALLVHLFVERKWVYLLMSGAAAGLAQLTKSSSIVVIPLVGLLFLADVLYRSQIPLRQRGRVALIELGVWLMALGAVYVALWPGMWVAPGKMLHEVFGNAWSYAFEGSRLAAATGAPATPFEPRLSDILLYAQSVLWRTTPAVWFGGLLAFGAFVRGTREARTALISVFAIGALFIILFGIASGRNSAHYVLTSYVALDILAAAGLVHAVGWLADRLPRGSRLLPIGLVCAVIVFQAASALRFFPYYYTYYSPVMEALDPGLQDPNFGYGEGLDLAAAYLSQKPGAQASTAMAFYGRGPFSWFYPGKTEPLKTVYADAENVPELQQALRRTDYLVIYYALEKGRNSPANVMRALEHATPEKTIWLDGIEYVRIYRVDALPAGFSDMLQP